MGGLNRGPRKVERLNPFNVHKRVLKLGLKNLDYLLQRYKKQKALEDEQAGNEESCTWNFATCKTSSTAH